MLWTCNLNVIFFSKYSAILNAWKKIPQIIKDVGCSLSLKRVSTCMIRDITTSLEPITVQYSTYTSVMWKLEAFNEQTLRITETLQILDFYMTEKMLFWEFWHVHACLTFPRFFFFEIRGNFFRDGKRN